MSNVYRCKAVVLGDQKVGKTCILNCLQDYPEPFSRRYLITKGVSIVCKPVKIVNQSESIVEIYLYDFSGLDSIYGDLMRKLWSNEVSMIVGVFDLCRDDTFNYLQTIVAEFMRGATSRRESIVGIILGNKSDLIEQRIVMQEDASEWAKKVRMRYLDCSAKEDVNIKEAFHHLAKSWYEIYRS